MGSGGPLGPPGKVLALWIAVWRATHTLAIAKREIWRELRPLERAARELEERSEAGEEIDDGQLRALDAQIDTLYARLDAPSRQA